MARAFGTGAVLLVPVLIAGAGQLATPPAIALALYVIVLTLITLVTTFVTPDTRARDLTLLGDAVDDDTREIADRPAPLVASYRNSEKASPVSV